MILPGDELTVNIKHIGMQDGNIVVKVQTVNQRGEKVLEATAEVAQPTTVYVFTGQGSQERGVEWSFTTTPQPRAPCGMRPTLISPQSMGSPIIEIVKNPKEKTIHFGGIKGQAIRQRYMDMTYDTMDKDGNVKTLRPVLCAWSCNAGDGPVARSCGEIRTSIQMDHRVVSISNVTQVAFLESRIYPKA